MESTNTSEKSPIFHESTRDMRHFTGETEELFSYFDRSLPKQFDLFLYHHNQVRNYPGEFLFDYDKISLTKKMIDVTFIAPLAALSDVISGIALFIIQFFPAVFLGTLGFAVQLIKNHPREALGVLQDASDIVKDAFGNLYNAAQKILCLVPFLGIFVYDAILQAESDFMKAFFPVDHQ